MPTLKIETARPRGGLKVEGGDPAGLKSLGDTPGAFARRDGPCSQGCRGAVDIGMASFHPARLIACNTRRCPASFSASVFGGKNPVPNSKKAGLRGKFCRQCFGRDVNLDHDHDSPWPYKRWRDCA